MPDALPSQINVSIGLAMPPKRQEVKECVFFNLNNVFQKIRQQIISSTLPLVF